MPKPEKLDDIAETRLRIARLVREGRDPSGHVIHLIELLKKEQDRVLRQKTNERFGKRRARELKKERGGYHSFEWKGRQHS